MVERRAELAACAVDPRGDPPDAEPEGLEQERERAVELVAEAAAVAADHLGQQVAGGQRDGLAQVNAEVLERHGEQVRAVQPA